MASCLLSSSQTTMLEVKENAFQRETKASLQGVTENLSTKAASGKDCAGSGLHCGNWAIDFSSARASPKMIS